MSTESSVGSGRSDAVPRPGDDQSWITLPNLEVLKSHNDNFKFQTFRNYFGAFALAITDTYGESPYGRLAVTVRGLPGVHKLQRRALSDIESRRATHDLRAAWGFEVALGRLAEIATDDAPELVMIENLTLAVSAHYALYRASRALSLARGDRAPEQHEEYLEQTATQLVQRGLLPLPLCCSCASGSPPNSPTRTAHAFNGFPVEGVEPCDAGLSPDTGVMWQLIAKALKTTRDSHRTFEVKKDAWRKNHPVRHSRKAPGSTRKRPVPHEIQDQIYAEMRPVNVFDLIYRMRRRSHYLDDVSFLSPDISASDARAFNRDLTLITRSALQAFEVLIEVAAGPALINDAKAEFAVRIGPALAKKTFGGRATGSAGTRTG